MGNNPETKVKFSIFNDEFNQGIKEINKETASMRKEFKLQSEQMKHTSTDTGKLEQNIKRLGKEKENVRRKIELTSQQLEKAKQYYGENSTEADKLSNQLLDLQISEQKIDNAITDSQQAIQKQTGAMGDAVPTAKSYREKLVDVGESAKAMGEKMQNIGRGMKDFGKSYSMHVTAPILALGGIAYKSADDIDKAYRLIQGSSGATGKELEDLKNDFKDVFKNTPDSAEDTAKAMSNLHKLTGLTGDGLKDLTHNVLDASAVMNEDAVDSSKSYAKAMNMWGVEAKDGSNQLNKLFKISQDYGVGLKDLNSKLTRNGSELKNAGFEMNEAAEFMASLEKNGVNVSRAMPGLSRAFRDWSKEGKNSKKELKSVIKQMKGAKNDTEALSIATDHFGSRGAQTLTNAIRSDALPAIDDLGGGLDDAGGSISDAYSETETFGDKIKELKNKVEVALEPMGHALIDALENAFDAAEPLIDKIEDGAEAFSNMSKEQQQTILKIAGFVAAIGPASIVVGNLTTAIGGTVKMFGSAASMLGKVGGKGLIGRIGLMGAGAGPVGLAVAGMTGLGVATYEFHKKAEKAKEVNLDLADSFIDEATHLKNSADTFDKLSDKAKLSNDQLAELNDLNKRIADSSNPGEIKELKSRYSELAEESGLSKKEIKRLIKANDDMVKNSPSVQKSVSDEGNEFAKNTDKVNEYIRTLYKSSEAEIEGERKKLLKQEGEIRDELNHKQQVYTNEESKLNELTKIQNLSHDELLDRKQKIVDKINEGNISESERKELNSQYDAILQAQTGEIDDQIIKQTDEVKKARESKEEAEKKLGKLDEQNEQFANLRLKQIGVNEEGEKGLSQLDKNIEKHQQEIDKLQQKKKSKKGLTNEEQKQLDKLNKKLKKEEDAKQKIFEETGLYNDLNSTVDEQISKLDKKKKKKIESLGKTADIKVEEGNVLKQIDKQNGSIDGQIKKLEESKKKEGDNKTEIQGQIDKLKGKKAQNASIKEQILKELGLWDKLDDNIKKGIRSESKKGTEIDKNNSKTDKGINKEKKRTSEAKKPAHKKVTASDHGTVAKINKIATAPKKKLVSLFQKGLSTINRGATTPKSKKVNLFQSGLAKINSLASNPITKTINFVGKGLSKLKFWAKGTDSHPGGPAMLGEEGPELVKQGRNWSLASTGVYDLKRGSKVFTNEQSERILKSIKRMPAYADGIGVNKDMSNRLDKAVGDNLVNRRYDINNQVNVNIESSDVIMDDKKVGKILWRPIHQNIKRNERRSRQGPKG